MSKKLVAVTMAALMGALPSPALAQAACRNSAELHAIAVRMLTTELMVAALGCTGATEDSFRNRYGSFVQKFNADLVKNGSLLKSHYTRYGGESRMNMMVTQLANLAEQRRRSDPNFCVDTDRKLNIGLASETTRLEQVPMPGDYYIGALGIRDCSTPAAKPPAPATKK
ncbi:MAG: hypothetical protein AB7R90_19020 [Reyranellaceae bacterium]